MPGVTGKATRSGQVGRPTETGLVLAPFRAVRYEPARVSDLADVTAPPYDVIDVDARATLEFADPHNIVRLILPGEDGGGRAGRYARAARMLRSWLESGVLVTDPEPGLYVYEQALDRVLQRGLIGALALRRPEEGIVLPHENVMPGPVTDRLELMRATAANLEPILLQCDDSATTAEILDATAATRPLVEAVSPDGVRHRVWRLSDQPRITAVQADLRERQAMIADGHHRYAAYLRLQADHRAAGHGSGPWDYGLALLVDAGRHPFQMRAIHRVLTRAAAADLAARVAPHAQVIELSAISMPVNLASLDAIDGAAFLLAGGGRQWLIRDIERELVDRLVPHGPPEAWRRLDATVLHHVLLEHVWGIPDDPEDVAYHHDMHAALRHAERTHGAAILMRPAQVSTVLDLARRGVRMPRKTTSFGPKPRSGLVLRLFAAG
jgi:uncharacterized protein (DUF1015 family)